MLIEIIGLPGSGKSTLLKKLMNDPDLKSFSTWQEVRVKAIRDYMINEGIELSNFIKLIFLIPILNNYLSRILFQFKIKYSHHAYKGFWGYFSEAVIMGILSKKSMSPEQIPYYINWELEKIIRAQIIRYYCDNTGENVILDEGQVTSIVTLDFNPNLFNKSTLPDAILFLKNNPKIALNGILERKEKGIINLSKRNKNEKEILYSLTEKYKRYNSSVEYLKNIGVPIIEYHRNDSYEILKQNINEVLKNMS
ncbi:hypothetical protein [Natronospora cellulosivora (SeqCode)]